jgi:hypothetical protein
MSASEMDTAGAASGIHKAAELSAPRLIAVNRVYAPDPVRRTTGRRRNSSPIGPRRVLSDTAARADLHLVSRDSAREGPMVPAPMMPTKRYGIMAPSRPALFLGSPDGPWPGYCAPTTRVLPSAARALKGLPRDRASARSLTRLTETGRTAQAAYERHYTRVYAIAAWREVVMLPKSDARHLTASKHSAA